METGDTGANITATARKQEEQIQDENRAGLQVAGLEDDELQNDDGEQLPQAKMAPNMLDD